MDNPAQNFDQSSQLIDRLAAIEGKIDMLLDMMREIVGPDRPLNPGDKV